VTNDYAVALVTMAAWLLSSEAPFNSWRILHADCFAIRVKHVHLGISSRAHGKFAAFTIGGAHRIRKIRV
jgi:hypothetical protein